MLETKLNSSIKNLFILNQMRIIFKTTLLIICISIALSLLLDAKGGNEEPYFATEPVFQYDTAHHENHASSIAQMPNGDLLVTWFGGSKEGNPDVALWVSRRLKGSKTWSKPARLVDNPDKAEGNSILFTDSKDKVWLFYVVKYGGERTDWSKGKAYAQTSDDNGYTWSEPWEVKVAIRNNVVELPDGRLLLPGTFGNPLRSGVAISGDGFRTQEDYVAPVSKPASTQPAVAHLGEGRMIMMMRNHVEGGRVWMSTSDDWGKTWSKPKWTKFYNPDSGISLISLKSGALVLAFNDSPWERTLLSVAMSEDGGVSWQYKKVLESKGMEFSYPFLIQDTDGIIHLTYTSDGRKFIKHAEFNEAWLKEK
ncbi:MAG: sialidase family protein [bacterium]